MHALKGSAGLAGERELADVLLRVERRFREGDKHASVDAAEVVRLAISRLSAGGRAVAVEWPEPPEPINPFR